MAAKPMKAQIKDNAPATEPSGQIGPMVSRRFAETGIS
jgi:hypothetical protein